MGAAGQDWTPVRLYCNSSGRLLPVDNSGQACYNAASQSGRGAARLAHLHGVQGVGSSNLLAPTTSIETFGWPRGFLAAQAMPPAAVRAGARTRSGRSRLSSHSPRGQAANAASPVCRFYGLPGAGLDSHFYSASRSECGRVASQFAGAWRKETDNAFRATLPDPDSGRCPAGTLAVFRLWNGRSDSNHRYTTDIGIRNAMIAKGYTAEGYGPLGVAMCALL